MKLNNNVWVTGAGHKNGLGYAISEELIKNDFLVIRYDIDFDKDVSGIKLDITNESEVEKRFDTEPYYLPKAIINCAGINITGEFVGYNLEWLKKTFEVNVMGNFIFSREFVRKTLQNESPKYIINIGSDSANTPRTNSFAYCASKAALQMFTRCWARDLAKYGYRIIEIDPSLILNTNMDVYINQKAAELQNKTSEEIKNDRLARVPLNRFATTKELAKWIPFLLKNGEYANGSCIKITGGVI